MLENKTYRAPLAPEPEATGDGGPDEAAVCAPGTAAAISLTHSWLRHPILNSIITWPRYLLQIQW